MSKKYLRKNEFRYDTNPKIARPDGKGHNVYVSVKHGHKAKVNVITHSKTFFGEKTIELNDNPNKSKFDNRKSRISIPFWENDNYLKNYSKGTWYMSKQNKSIIRKTNKKRKH